MASRKQARFDPVPRVYVSRVKQPLDPEQILAALGWVGWEDIVARDARVFVKPNLTWHVPTPGVTTTPTFIRWVLAALRTRTTNLIIGESNGGYHSYEAEEALRGHDVYAAAEESGARVVNLSKQPVERAVTRVMGVDLEVELPAMLLHEIDVFVTLPVPKIHAMTRVSLAFKNQWGCQPDTMRLRKHAQFDRKIVAINRLLNPQLALYDGTYFLDKNGPMHGVPVRMDVLLAANQIGAGDLTCCRLMQVEAGRVGHYQVAQAEGLFPAGSDPIEINQPVEPLRGRRFRLERSLVNLVALAAFNSSRLTYLLYESSFGGALHRAFYSVRRNKLIGRLLHGELGPPNMSGSSKPQSSLGLRPERKTSKPSR